MGCTADTWRVGPLGVDNAELCTGQLGQIQGDAGGDSRVFPAGVKEEGVFSPMLFTTTLQ